ncbi:MAG TPA: type IV secretory system conjugative DNA transfer family protein [Candidatus Dormibacteraeota bacterium]
MNDRPVPRARSRRADLVILSVLAAAWLVPWLLLTGAAIVSGGHPVISPFDFINPVRLVTLYHTDGNAIVWWHLVGAMQPAHLWLFVGFIAVAVTATAATVVGILLAWAGGVPGIGASRLLVPGRLRRTSRWATWRDLRPLQVRRAPPGSLVLGRRGAHLIATEAETSVLVIGPTRSGKTSGLVVPNLLDWQGPAIVTSTKSELVDLTAAHRRSIGPVSVYDPTGEIDDRSDTVSWSPLAGCDVLDVAWTVAAWLCAGLQQGGGRGDNDWAHWAESGKLLIAPLLYTAAACDRTIVDVRDWIHCFDIDTPMALLIDLSSAHPSRDADPQRAIAMLNSIEQRPEKERGTVFSTVMRIFSVFNERAVAASAMTSRFDPQCFLRDRGTLYLCTPRQSPERIASLFVGILMTVVTSAYVMAARQTRGRLQPELGLFLDELANVVPIEELPALASQGAGRGIVLMSIIQDFSQLRTRYGADRANSILNNHGCKMVLPGISDPETTEVIAKLVGRGEYTDVQVTNNDGRASRSYSLRQDQMASPDALRQLQEGTGVVLYRGKPPTIVRLRPWYADRKLSDLVNGAAAGR